LVRGLSNRSIAAEQCITEDTVETDLRTLFHNFRAEDRTQLLFLAKEVFPEAFRDADGFLISGSATME
jgi:DNA-binding NarL/FixJ family response regulator